MNWILLLAYLPLCAVVVRSNYISLKDEPNIPAKELNALFELYNSTNGAEWTWKGTGSVWNFTSTANPCADDWEGIVCLLPSPYTVNYIWQINLQSYNLAGKIPDSIGNFSLLALLVLNSNSIVGTIPTSVESLVELNTLQIQVNSLTGTIPDIFDKLPSLSSLALSYNDLSGQIPSTITDVPFMEYLGLSKNQLSGPIPNNIGSLSYLTNIELNSNALTGSIPFSISHLSELVRLQLYENDFTGSLPEELSQLSKLQNFELQENMLDGTIPSSYGNLTLVENFLLNNNELTGSLPTELMNMTALQYIQLDDNQLNGTIPQEWGYLARLTYLSLQNNNFTGSIPVSLCSLTRLNSLYLSGNKLTGSLPNDIGNLSLLTTLAIAGNHLEGSIPDSIGSMIVLEDLDLSSNKMVGPIPHSIVQLGGLAEFSMYDNAITGPFPTILCNISTLVSLRLGANLLHGPLPVCLASLSDLQVLSLQETLLTGTLPEEYGTLSKLSALALQSCGGIQGIIPPSFAGLQSLKILTLAFNSITGTIPSFLGNLSNLEIITLYQNAITGTLPPELGYAPSLKALDCSNNQLGGNIPDSYGNFTSLVYFGAENNHIHGTIPSSLGEVSTLQSLTLSNCLLSGTLPDSLRKLDKLQNLGLGHNLLTGTIPETYGNLKQLRFLSLFSNILTGTIPTSLSGLVSLISLLLHTNELDGHIDQLFDPTTQLYLASIQLSSNKLSGTIPAQAFQLPKLQSFISVGNCFDGTLPQTICGAVNVQTLEMDALHSSSTCQSKLFDGLDTYITKNAVAGNIPSCIFSLPKLTTLHLSSNALTGSLPGDLQISNSLTDLTLSYNKITGSIPRAMQQRSWYNLDLSYNRLSGTLSKDFAAPLPSSIALYLQFNKLSGSIPSSMRHATNISVLKSNIFDCDLDRSDLPSNDPYVAIYQCGSESTDAPFYAYLACACAALTVFGALYMWRSEMKSCLNLSSTFRICEHWLCVSSENRTAPISPSLVGISAMFTALCQVALWLALYAVVVLVPAFAILSAYCGTHTYEYIWSVSAVLKEGVASLTVEFVLFFIGLCVCLAAYGFYSLHVCTLRVSAVSGLDATDSNTRNREVQVQSYWNWEVIKPTVLCVTYVFINVVVVGVVNIYYVFLKLNSTPGFQLILSAFKVLWNGICAPTLSRQLLRPRPAYASLELVVSICNLVVIPIIAVVFVSPDCFYHAFVQEGKLSVSYSSYTCEVQTATNCAVSSEEYETVEFHPPYLYNFQCSYALGDYYVPAYLYVCLFATFGAPLVDMMLARIHAYVASTHATSSGSDSVFSKCVDRVVPPLLKCLKSDLEVNQPASQYRPIFDAMQFSMVLFSLLALLMTFGMIFPPLGACIAVTMVASSLYTRLKIGRVLTVASEQGYVTYIGIVEQECASVPRENMLRVAIRFIFTVSSCFYALFLFDTMGTQSGFHGAYWVLFTFPASTLLIYGAILALRFVRPELLAPIAVRETHPTTSSSSASIDRISTSTLNFVDKHDTEQKQETYNALNNHMAEL